MSTTYFKCVLCLSNCTVLIWYCFHTKKGEMICRNGICETCLNESDTLAQKYPLNYDWYCSLKCCDETDDIDMNYSYSPNGYYVQDQHEKLLVFSTTKMKEKLDVFPNVLANIIVEYMF